MSDPQAPAYRRRVIIATSIGNALEWFDFVVYGFLAVTMARLFFPASDGVTALLLVFATFGIPFLARPLGAVVIGAYADRRGRKPALTLTIGLMLAGTAMMAFVPSHASIGIVAPLIVTAARVLQGLSVGGEYGAATAFLIEQDERQRGYLASWQYASQSVTTVLATGFGALLNAVLTPAALEAWGWRIPFVFGLLLGPVGYYIRKHLTETAPFAATPPSHAPARTVIVEHWRSLLLCVGVIAVTSISVYMFLFMPTFAIRQLGLAPAASYLGGLLGGSIQIVLIPIVGWLSDRHGRTLMPLAASIAILLLAYPMFALLVAVPSLWTLLAVQAALAVLNAVNLGTLGGLLSTLFPTRVLSSGLAIGNALATMIFGGFAPLISVWLIEVTGSPLAPSFYLMLGAVISVAAIGSIRRGASPRLS